MEKISRKEAKALGLKTFFTGEPCKHGHIAERCVARYICTECNRVRANKYYKENRELVLSKINTEHRKAYEKEYHKKNKETLAAKRAVYRAKNKKEFAAYDVQYRAANKEQIQARRANYRKENSAKINADNKERKLSKSNRTPPWLTEDDLWMIQEIYDLAVLRTKLTGTDWEVDHIIPLKGKTESGLHVPSNLQVIPAVDNRRKNNKWDPDNV